MQIDIFLAYLAKMFSEIRIPKMGVPVLNNLNFMSARTGDLASPRTADMATACVDCRARSSHASDRKRQ